MIIMIANVSSKKWIRYLLLVYKNNINQHGTNRWEAKVRMSYKCDLGFCYTNCCHSFVGKIISMNN